MARKDYYRTSVVLHKEHLAKLQRIADAQGRSVSSLVRFLLEEAIKRPDIVSPLSAKVDGETTVLDEIIAKE